MNSAARPTIPAFRRLQHRQMLPRRQSTLLENTISEEEIRHIGKEADEIEETEVFGATQHSHVEYASARRSRSHV